MELTRNAYKILVDEPEGKRKLGRRNLRWMGNMRDVHVVRECRLNRLDWAGLTKLIVAFLNLRTRLKIVV